MLTYPLLPPAIARSRRRKILRTRLVDWLFQRRARMPCQTLVAATLVGAIAAMLGASSAHASYVNVDTNSYGNTELTYYADLYGTNFGRSYSAGISGSPNPGFVITDWRVTLDVGSNCLRSPPGKRQAVCQKPPVNLVSAVKMFYGDGDDYALIAITGANAFVYGEGGDDYLRGNSEPDYLYGGSGNDVLDGGDGSDTLFPQGGNDTLIGGAGDDWVEYTDYSTEVSVSLNGVADDGAAGERQNVVDVERVYGGHAGDTLTGNNDANILHGGMQGNDVIEGGGGADQLDGSTGDDVIDGGGGQDDLGGNTGDDTIWALDNEVDKIECGDGYDQVLADYKDNVLPGCEAVSRV